MDSMSPLQRPLDSQLITIQAGLFSEIQLPLWLYAFTIIKICCNYDSVVLKYLKPYTAAAATSQYAFSGTSKVFSACWCASLWAYPPHSWTTWLFITTHMHTKSDWRDMEYIAVEDLNWGQTYRRFLKEPQQAGSIKINKTANVNKSIKLNARPMLRKCHWLFIMGPLSRGVKLQHVLPA